jgi:hypothetical protein
MRAVRFLGTALVTLAASCLVGAAESAVSTGTPAVQIRGLTQVSAKGGVIPFLFVNGDVAEHPPMYGFIDKWSRGKWRPLSEHLLGQGFGPQIDGYSKPGLVGGVPITNLPLPKMAPRGRVGASLWMPPNVLRAGVRYRLRPSKFVSVPPGFSFVVDESTSWEFTAKNIRPFELARLAVNAIVPATTDTPSYLSSDCVDVVKVRLVDGPKALARWGDVRRRWEPETTVLSPDDCAELRPGIYRFLLTPDAYGEFASFVVV